VATSAGIAAGRVQVAGTHAQVTDQARVCVCIYIYIVPDQRMRCWPEIDCAPYSIANRKLRGFHQIRIPHGARSLRQRAAPKRRGRQAMRRGGGAADGFCHLKRSDSKNQKQFYKKKQNRKALGSRACLRTAPALQTTLLQWSWQRLARKNLWGWAADEDGPG
jgi:hypothetical protein